MFAWLGTIFVMLFGLPVLLNHYFNIDMNNQDFQFIDLFSFDCYLNASAKLDPIILEMDYYMQTNYFDSIKMNYSNVKNDCIIFMILLTVSAFVAIGGLMGWHAGLITRGETCIESLRNKKERIRFKKLKQRFVNPFDKGSKNNWRRFFGLDQEGITLRRVLFPSTHKPFGDGIVWDFDLFS